MTFMNLSKHQCCMCFFFRDARRAYWVGLTYTNDEKRWLDTKKEPESEPGWFERRFRWLLEKLGLSDKDILMCGALRRVKHSNTSELEKIDCRDSNVFICQKGEWIVFCLKYSVCNAESLCPITYECKWICECVWTRSCTVPRIPAMSIYVSHCEYM